MNTFDLIAALVDVLNASTRPPALAALFRPRYLRELRAYQTSHGLAVDIYKYGYNRYKNHGPRPTIPPPPVFPDGIKQALNAVLPQGIAVTDVQDCGPYITILFMLEA